MTDDQIKAAERIIQQNEFESLEEQVRKQQEALRLVLDVLKEAVKELGRLQRGEAAPAKYRFPR